MNIRQIELEKDYPMLEQWWTTWGWPAIPKNTLPSTGYLVAWDDKPLMAGWLYLPKEDTKIGWFEWAVSNPDATSQERAESLKVLVDMIKDVGIENNLKLIFTSTNKPSFGDKLSQCGFNKTDENVVIYMKFL